MQYMPRVCLNLSDKTAQRFKEVALKETGNMKGLNIVCEVAIKEYLEGRYSKMTTFIIRRNSDDERKMTDVAQEEPTESAQIQQTVPV
jgi:hypothetical protein